MKFNYYYGSQADQFSFIRIPRMLLVDPMFQPLSVQSKMLYGVLLDRMGLSMRNGWFDEENRVYIIYQIAEIQEDLGFSKKKAIEYLAELEQFGLVEKKRRGRGLPSILYVKSFMTASAAEVRSAENGTSQADGIDDESSENTPFEENCSYGRSSEIDTSENTENTRIDPSVQAENTRIGTSGQAESPRIGFSEQARSSHIDTSQPVRSTHIDTSRSAETALPEVPISTPPEVPKSTLLKNYNNINYTDMSYISSNHTLSAEDGETAPGWDADEMGDGEDYSEIIAEHIGLEDLRADPGYDSDLVDGIYDLILETLASRSKTVVIASGEYPTELVKQRFLRLNSAHIEYVLECFARNTTRVRNIKKYLLAALFNAPSTIGGYYSAEVRHDMPYLAAR